MIFDSTANQEKEFNASNGRKTYVRIFDNDVHKMIRAVEERQQLQRSSKLFLLSTATVNHSET